MHSKRRSGRPGLLRVPDGRAAIAVLPFFAGAFGLTLQFEDAPASLAPGLQPATLPPFVIAVMVGLAAAPVIMGLVLGEPVESSLKQSLILFEGQWWRFFERPIVRTFFALTALAPAAPLLTRPREQIRPAV